MASENHRSCLRSAPARPIETGTCFEIPSHIRSSLPLAPAGSWHFRGDVRALALGHAGLLRWDGGAAEVRPGRRRLGGAMIGRAALLHKRFQETGPPCCQAARAWGWAARCLMPVSPLPDMDQILRVTPLLDL